MTTQTPGGRTHAALAETEAGLGDSGVSVERVSVEEVSAEEAESWTARPAPIVSAIELEAEGPDPLIGRILSGLYKVQNRIGEGGMGTVYMALHVHLNKPFAVKVLAESIATNRSAVDRLLQEAQAASSIDHDNIVDVVSFDSTEDGRVFLVMEMLEGVSLGELVDRGPMTLQRALPILYQLCDALGAAHDRGIVHRDLKPDNVFIVHKADADFVKVLDFGISKVKSAEAEQVRMTKTGQLVGTPLYMSPEQAKGEPDIDLRSDVYSLGVMLYEMLVGRPPFEGGNYFQLLWKHGNEVPVAPHVVMPAIPKGVSNAIMKSLAKRREDRYQTTQELREALEHAAPEVFAGSARLVSMPPARALDSGPQHVSPVARPSRLRWVVAALALVAVVAIAFMLTNREGDDAVASNESVQELGNDSVEDPVEDLAEDPSHQTDPAGADPVDGPTLPVAAPTPELVEIRFESTPPGARVVRTDTDRVLGETPFAAELLEGETFEVEFRRAGSRTRRVSVEVERDGVVETRLLRPRAPMNDDGIPMGRTTL